MNKPTEEQIKKLWEWCGIEEKLEGDTGVRYYHYPNHLCDIQLPPADLNNLFKWAVPKLQFKGFVINLVAMEFASFRIHVLDITTSKEWHFEKDEADPALALLLAILQVIEEEL